MYLADKSGPLCGEGTVRSARTWHVTVPTVDTYPLGVQGIGVAAPGSIPSLRLGAGFHLTRLSVALLGMYYSRSQPVVM